MTLKLQTENNNKNVLFYDFNEERDDSEDILNIIKLLEVQNIKRVILENINDKTFSSLEVSHLFFLVKKLRENKIDIDLKKLNKNTQDMLNLALQVQNNPPQDFVKNDFFENMGQKYLDLLNNIKNIFSFIIEILISFGRFCFGNAIFRAKDFWFILGDCSYKALGIISLVSFLVGLILAFVGALQLKTFGAGIYVASMVAMGMTRIMSAIMVGIIMAGRTGSSYAATLGTMQVNEEIDALKTLGINTTDYLVTPRLVALVFSIPFLTLLSDILGILGGAVVGLAFLDINSTAYLEYSIKALSLSNILVGLLHSLIFGIIISICGCYAGLHAGRDADAVGLATTRAVVSSLVSMIIATGILTVILELLGI